MRLREAAFLIGLGEFFFRQRWSCDRTSLSAFKPFHDETESLFVHIPKTAGISVYKSLYAQSALYGHAPALAFQFRDPIKFDKYFKFSFIRNPTERFASAFYFLKAGGLTAQDDAWSSLNLFGIETPDDLLVSMQNPFRRAAIISWKHFIPQSWYISGRDRAISLDFIGRVDSFEQSLLEISKRLDRPPCSTVQINRSSRPRITRLHPEAQRRLERIYHSDFELFESLR